MNQSALTSVHRAAGAVLTDGDAPLLLTYGEVPDEYRAALEDCVLLDETDRGLVHVEGPEAVEFLHRILANDVRNLAPGSGNRNLLLTAKGKVRFVFDLSLAEEGATLSTEPARAPELIQAIDMYLFAEDAKLGDATETHAPIAIVGTRAHERARELLGTELPEEDHEVFRAKIAGLEVQGVTLSIAGSPAVRLDAGPANAEALWSALRKGGIAPAGRIALDSLRVEAGRAQPGVDIDESIYPQEARLEQAFSLEKGCYIGQEVVAKIDTYGGLNKRLVALRVSHDDPVAHGTRLAREDDGEWRDLGVVTSWAYSFVHDTGLVLGYVKRRHQAVGTEFRLGDGPATATVVELPARAGALELTGEFE